MLPAVVVERLLACRGMKFDGPSNEKRKHIRYPFRSTVSIRLLTGANLSPPIKASIKDISLTGLGVVIPRGIQLSELWLLTIPSPRGEITLKCRHVRRTNAGPTNEILGTRIVAMLQPGMTVSNTTQYDTLKWEYVETLSPLTN